MENQNPQFTNPSEQSGNNFSNNQNPHSWQQYGSQKIPNASTVLTLGIISLVFTGLIGTILAIIALSTSKTAMQEYNANPDLYSKSSYNNLKAGRICAIISLSLFGVLLLVILIAVAASNF